MATAEMSSDEIEAFLRQQGSGVLALSDDADAYAIPESFGYDGEDLYFQFIYDDDSRKMAFVGSTDTATFTTFTEEPPRSVVVRGHLECVPEDNELVATEAIADNSVFPTLNVVPDRPVEELSYEYYRLVPAERTGRVFRGSFD